MGILLLQICEFAKIYRYMVGMLCLFILQYYS